MERNICCPSLVPDWLWQDHGLKDTPQEKNSASTEKQEIQVLIEDQFQLRMLVSSFGVGVIAFAEGVGMGYHAAVGKKMDVGIHHFVDQHDSHGNQQHVGQQTLGCISKETTHLWWQRNEFSGSGAYPISGIHFRPDYLERI